MLNSSWEEFQTRKTGLFLPVFIWQSYLSVISKLMRRWKRSEQQVCKLKQQHSTRSLTCNLILMFDCGIPVTNCIIYISVLNSSCREAHLCIYIFQEITLSARVCIERLNVYHVLVNAWQHKKSMPSVVTSNTHQEENWNKKLKVRWV